MLRNFFMSFTNKQNQVLYKTNMDNTIFKIEKRKISQQDFHFLYVSNERGVADHIIDKSKVDQFIQILKGRKLQKLINTLHDDEGYTARIVMDFILRKRIEEDEFFENYKGKNMSPLFKYY